MSGFHRTNGAILLFCAKTILKKGIRSVGKNWVRNSADHVLHKAMQALKNRFCIIVHWRSGQSQQFWEGNEWRSIPCDLTHCISEKLVTFAKCMGCRLCLEFLCDVRNCWCKKLFKQKTCSFVQHAISPSYLAATSWGQGGFLVPGSASSPRSPWGQSPAQSRWRGRAQRWPEKRERKTWREW